ncbi:MAG: hypothetical protein OEY56_00400 [Cyclobacteriaceae bacterium]|nr:hypothetical protein [Cyclobacteriaceae bacterium]
MATPSFRQNVQDWITQQWVILFGEKINSTQNEWLLGPFGETDGIGEKFIKQLADKEHLEIDKSEKRKGLLQSVHQLNLAENDYNRLSKNVIDFYENTSQYHFALKADWNPAFRLFGVIVNRMFSKRIEQLNIPLDDGKTARKLTSEVIQLIDKKTKKVKRTIWLRMYLDTKQVVYSGVYEICTIPNGQCCIKTVFPLPNGNATVILYPEVGENGELILRSSGRKIGDCGFYFLLIDSNGILWTKFIKSFKEKLIVRSKNNQIAAEQILTLWNMRVLTFEYTIDKATNNHAQQKGQDVH